MTARSTSSATARSASSRPLGTPTATCRCCIAGGELLLAGDAAYARKTLDQRLVPLYLTGSRREYEHSLDHLVRHVEANPDTVVICGHDPWSWPTLEPVY